MNQSAHTLLLVNNVSPAFNIIKWAWCGLLFPTHTVCFTSTIKTRRCVHSLASVRFDVVQEASVFAFSTNEADAIQGGVIRPELVWLHLRTQTQTVRTSLLSSCYVNLQTRQWHRWSLLDFISKLFQLEHGELWSNYTLTASIIGNFCLLVCNMGEKWLLFTPTKQLSAVLEVLKRWQSQLICAPPHTKGTPAWAGVCAFTLRLKPTA